MVNPPWGLFVYRDVRLIQAMPEFPSILRTNNEHIAAPENIKVLSLLKASAFSCLNRHGVRFIDGRASHYFFVQSDCLKRMVFSAAWSTVTACRVPVALTSGSLLIQAILQDVIAVVIALAGFFPAKMSVEAIGTYFGVTVASQKKAFKTTVMHVFDHLRQQHAPQPLVFMTRQQRQHHDFSTLTVGEAIPGHLPVNAGYIAGAAAISDARAPALFCNAQGGKLLFRKRIFAGQGTNAQTLSRIVRYCRVQGCFTH